MRLTVPSFRSKMIGVFQFLELWKDEEGENKNEKRKGRRLTVQGLYLEVEKAVRALTQLFSDKGESGECSCDTNDHYQGLDLQTGISKKDFG